VQTVLPVSICAIIVMSVAAFFWNKYLDKKDNTPMEKIDVSEIKADAPAFYALLVVLSIFIGALVHYVVNKFDGKKSLDDLDACYDGMADAFKGAQVQVVSHSC